MFGNLYLNERKNDLPFLDRLSSIPDSYRAFLPFLENSYGSIFGEETSITGITMTEIKSLCQRARVLKPHYVSADLRSEKVKEDETTEHACIDRIAYDFSSPSPGRRYCIGIGHYDTKTQGKIHMCVLLDLYDRMIGAVSFSDAFDPQITENAIAHIYDYRGNGDFLIHSSQNAIYQKEEYKQILKYYGVLASMTQPKTRGGIMPISSFFSSLKRKLGGYAFVDREDAESWLSDYILSYNLKILEKEK